MRRRVDREPIPHWDVVLSLVPAKNRHGDSFPLPNVIAVAIL